MNIPMTPPTNIKKNSSKQKKTPASKEEAFGLKTPVMEKSKHQQLKELIDAHIKMVYNFIFRMTGNSDEAQDLTQETFIRIWKNINKYDPERNAKAWILAIARNATIDWIRKSKPLTFSQLQREGSDDSFEENIADLSPLADELFEQNERKLLTESILPKINPEYRAIILLHLFEEMTFEQIALALKRPINTVKSQYRRGLIELKKHADLHQKPLL